MRVSEPLYVGCKDRAGHYIWRRDGRSVSWIASGGSLGGVHLDGGFCPKREQAEGRARLTWTRDEADDPVTVLSFCDRSVNSRGGSHSTFVLPGELDFGDALDLARDSFPWVFARLGFVVVPVPERGQDVRS